MLKAKDLPYPTTQYCGLEVYRIPEDKKYEIQAAAYLFEPAPRPNDVLEDIHTGREFLFKDVLVVKNGDLVELEAPFFMEGAGSVIDWVPAPSPSARELRTAREASYQFGYDDGYYRQKEGLNHPIHRLSRSEKFNRLVDKDYTAGFKWGCQKRLNDLKAAGRTDEPVSVEDVLAALKDGHYKASVYSEYMFIRQCDDSHLAYIVAEELLAGEDEISIDVCGQHYKSTVYTNQWLSAASNTVPNDPRLAEALCNIPEYKDVTLESYLDLNYTRSEIEHQIAGYGTEIYFDFAASPGCNIVVRPRSADREFFTQWDELKARRYIKITLDQAVDYLYANRHEFNRASASQTNTRPSEIPAPQLTAEPPAPPPAADTPF